MPGRTIKWGALGTLAGILLGGVDTLIIFFNARSMFFDAAEMGRTMWMVVGMCAAAGMIAALLLSFTVEILTNLALPGKKLHAPFRLPLAITALTAIPIDLLLLSLSSGPAASKIPLRLPLVAIAATIAAAAFAFLIVRAVRLAKPSTKAGYIMAAVFVILSGTLVLANLKILVRLYPVFHSALFVMTLYSLIAALYFLCPKATKKILLLISALLVIGAIAGGSTALYKTRGTQNSRFIIKDKTISASEALKLTSTLFPPPPNLVLDEPVSSEALSATKTESTAHRFTIPGSPVIMMTIDAMRFDKLNAIVEKTNITPNISALAKRSVVFDQAYTPLPHTSYAISSLLTGKYTGPLFDVPGAPRVQETWPEILHRFRYKTAAFFTKAVFFIDRARFEPYLRKAYGFGTAKMDYRLPAAKRVEQTIEFLKKQHEMGERVFTWTHFFEPHEPYDPNCTAFGKEDERRYDCEINTVDKAAGTLLKYLDKDYPNAIIIVTADHGEEFGEHDGRYHGTTLYDEQIKVPLIMRVPGMKPRTVSEPVNLVDIMGTVLSLLEIPAPARVRSKDLTALMLGNKNDHRIAFSQVHELVMARKGHYKLILDKEEQITSLYDLQSDPKETVSISAQHPKITTNLTSQIGTWLKSHAYWELRPIKTTNGNESWPKPIQKALAGDMTAMKDLTAIALDNKEAQAVKRKAAQLFYELSKASNQPIKLEALSSIDDPETLAWLTLAQQSEPNNAAAQASLAKILPSLKQHSPIWTRSTLAVYKNEQTQAGSDSLITILGHNKTAMVLRQEAARLLGEAAIKRARIPLIEQINNYQLTLDVVQALGKIGDKKSCLPLITRLKRERFPKRRAAVTAALAALKDKRAASPIAIELTREHPTPNALAALADLGTLKTRFKTYKSKTDNTTVTIYPGWSKLKSFEQTTISRVITLTKAKSDGGSIDIYCNNQKTGSIPILTGRQQASLNLTCSLDPAGKTTLNLQIRPKDLTVKIEAVGVVKK